MSEAWLQARAPGYADLSATEREAIGSFLFLWSLFEAQALDGNGGSQTIVAAAERVCAHRPGLPGTFGEALAYFQDRDLDKGATNYRFEGLRFRPRDRRDFIEMVLTGQRQGPADQVAALLLIIYRLRNNLFHGAKWDIGLADQLDNFVHANKVLTAAMD
jgi:hypothetical protein